MKGGSSSIRNMIQCRERCKEFVFSYFHLGTSQIWHLNVGTLYELGKIAQLVGGNEILKYK